MSAAKKTPRKSVTKTLRANSSQIDSPARTASTIADAIALGSKFSQADGKVNIHIHVGDIILLGFDEAIDAEEWGMRENNTEIFEGANSQSKRRAASEPQDKDANRKTSRTINVRKGPLQLLAVENSEPVKRSGTRMKRVSTPAAKKRTQVKSKLL